MRDLNQTEVESVSGASLFSDIGSGLGFIVGTVIDSGAAAGGVTVKSVSATTQLGSGIGKVIGLDISGALNDIGAGVVGLLQYGINVVKGLNSSTS